VYSKNIIKNRYEELKNSVKYNKFKIHYAMKANSNYDGKAKLIRKRETLRNLISTKV